MTHGPSVLAVAVVAVACNRAEPDAAEAPDRAVPVVCEPAQAGAAVDQVTIRGVVAAPPDRDAVVAPGIAGRIVELRVREGESVSRGDLLARIEDPTVPDALAEAAAAVASAKASSEAARAAFDRAERLLAEGIVARRDVEESRARSESAEADLRAARSKAGLAAGQRSLSRPVAPLAGTVVRVFRHVGELVDGTPATPIVEIADATTLELVADAPAADLVRLRMDGAARATFDGDAEAIPGRVVALAPAVDPATSLGVVRVRLDDPSRVRIGMAGVAQIAVASRPNATLVPIGSLRRSPEGRDEVVVCGSDGRAHVHSVRLGARSDRHVEVVEGVAPGESVVTGHALGLADGAAITRSGAAP